MTEVFCSTDHVLQFIYFTSKQTDSPDALMASADSWVRVHICSSGGGKCCTTENHTNLNKFGANIYFKNDAGECRD